MAPRVVAQQPAFLTNGLVAYYPFNGNANDKSGNANNGTPLNVTPAKDRFDAANCAFHFNGLDGQITGSSMVVSNKIINIGQVGYTISFWFKPEDIFQQSRCLFNTIPHSGVGITFNNNNSPGYVSIALGPANAYWSILYLHGAKRNYQAGAWYSYTLVKDGAIYRQYINGALEHEYNNPVASVYNYDVQLRFGSINEVHQFFGGDMDDIRIYSRSLSTVEVKSLYDYESTPPNPVSITSHPTNITTDLTKDVSFSITATNALTYQWFKDGNALPSATNAILSLKNARPALIGDYFAVASNTYGTATSSVASLNIKGVDSGIWKGLVAWHRFTHEDSDDSVLSSRTISSGLQYTFDRVNSASNAVYFGQKGKMDKP